MFFFNSSSDSSEVTTHRAVQRVVRIVFTVTVITTAYTKCKPQQETYKKRQSSLKLLQTLNVVASREEETVQILRKNQRMYSNSTEPSFHQLLIIFL